MPRNFLNSIKQTDSSPGGACNFSKFDEQTIEAPSAKTQKILACPESTSTISSTYPKILARILRNPARRARP